MTRYLGSRNRDPDLGLTREAKCRLLRPPKKTIHAVNKRDSMAIEDASIRVGSSARAEIAFKNEQGEQMVHIDFIDTGPDQAI